MDVAAVYLQVIRNVVDGVRVSVERIMSVDSFRIFKGSWREAAN
jgi:hypothetical protein